MSNIQPQSNRLSLPQKDLRPVNVKQPPSEQPALSFPQKYLRPANVKQPASEQTALSSSERFKNSQCQTASLRATSSLFLRKI